MSTLFVTNLDMLDTSTGNKSKYGKKLMSPNSHLIGIYDLFYRCLFLVYFYAVFKKCFTFSMAVMHEPVYVKWFT